jgi:hypothetical protein
MTSAGESTEQPGWPEARQLHLPDEIEIKRGKLVTTQRQNTRPQETSGEMLDVRIAGIALRHLIVATTLFLLVALVLIFI